MNVLLTLIFLLPLTPAIQWSVAAQHDFGVLKKGRPVFHTFPFTNRSDEPVVIETIRTTCGCTIPEWSETPILPDSTGQIKVTYDANQRGRFKKLIKVYFHGIPKAERLYIQGEVE